MNQLQLKKLAAEDFDLYYRLVGNSSVMAHICGRALTREEATDSFRSMLHNNELHSELGHFKVIDAHSGETIGVMQLCVEESDSTEAEASLLLMPQHWGCGHGRMLIPALLERARSVSLLTDLFAVIDPRCAAAKRLLQAAGFTASHSFVADGLTSEVLTLSLR